MADPAMPPRSTVTGAIRADGTLRVRPLGGRQMPWGDLYHRLLRTSWPRLGLLFVASFMAFNLSFAVLYGADPAGLAIPHDTAQVPIFWRHFFFSVHTVATIGYGNVYPVSLYANCVVVAEITLGILFFALTTGIVFARFSRPSARILFSKVLLVQDVEGVPTLMLRAANQRHNLLYSAEAKLSLLSDSTVQGVTMRRFTELGLVRSSNPAFALTWTIMHAIDAASPLRHWFDDPAIIGGGEIIVVLSAQDEASGHTIHGRWAYGGADIRWNARFADILGTDASGQRTIDYARFHDFHDL